MFRNQHVNFFRAFQQDFCRDPNHRMRSGFTKKRVDNLPVTDSFVKHYYGFCLLSFLRVSMDNILSMECGLKSINK